MDATRQALEPDRDQLEVFAEALFRYAGQQGFVSLRAFYEDDAGKPFRISPTPLAGGFKFLIDVAEDVARRAANDPKPVVFCPPLATFSNGRRATEDDVAEGLVLSVECDAHPQEACAKLEQILGPASIVVRSGGRWTDPQTGERSDKLHLHWRLAEPATGKGLALLKRARTLATRLVGGDPSNVPIVHPIRWPGSWHRKGEPRLCAIETADPDREIVLELALDALETAAPTQQMDGGTAPAADDNRRTEWEDAFRAVLSGESYHPTLVPLAASFAAWGAPEPVTDNVLRCLLINSRPQDPERERRRDAELGKLPETVASAYAKYSNNSGGESGKEKTTVHWYGENGDHATPREALVDGLLPRTGTGLISGQWGAYKTFVAIDLSAAIMAGLAFIEYPIARRGGVLFIATEGASELSIRLKAALERQQVERAPFAWIDECPRLLGPKAVEQLAEIANAVAERMQHEFGLPLALILIDTMVDAAGYTKSGDENDAALGQLIMRRCADLSRRTGALVLGIDHFGKAIETGTRGSSAKEARADVVLAVLADKSVSGEVTNTRLAVRKNRAGPAGQEHAFTVQIVDLGNPEREITSLVINWGQGPKAAKPDEKWAKSLRLLRQALMDLLAGDQASEQRPFADGPLVRAIDLDLVRAEFCRMYPALEGTPARKNATRRMAFHRAVTGAQGKGLVGIRDIGATTFIWLAAP